MPADRGLVWTACITEHLFGGMATVALFTLMMDASDPEHAGTDYTLLACAVVVAQGLAAFAACRARRCLRLSVGVRGGLRGGRHRLRALIATLDRGHGPSRLDAVWRHTGAAGQA